MTGQKGLAIAITALLLTVCIGYLFNAEKTTVDSLVYEEKADLSPLIYENSSRVGGTEVYNAAVNVTGWLPTSAVPTTNNPNQYRFTESSINYNADVTQSITMAGSGLTYTMVKGFSGGWHMETNTGGKYFSGLTDTNGQTIHGGRSYPDGVNNRYVLQLNGQTIPNGDYLFWVKVNELYNFKANDYLYMNTGATFYKDVTISTSGNMQDYEGGAFINVTGTQTNAAYGIYNYSTETWTLYNSDNTLNTASADNVYIILQSAPDQAFTFKYKTFAGVTNAVYADPTKLVTGQTLTWNRGVSQPYAGYKLILKIDNTPNETEIGFVRTSGPYTQSETARIAIKVDSEGIIEFRHTAGGSSNPIPWRTLGNASSIAGVLLDIDCEHKIGTITGIAAFDPTAPRLNYTLVPNPMQFSILFSNLIGGGISITNDTRAIGAAVVETTIYTDPSGVLWNNFNLNLLNYFPSIINNDNEGVRVQLGGFVTYGDSITINGRTFTVTDGNITVPLTDGVTVRNREMPLSGMAIDYTKDGKVNLIFTENLNKVAELGDRVNYTLAGSGAWYFSSDLNEINQSHKEVWNWSTDWSLDANATCLVYLGLLILGVVIGLYLGRGNLEIYDYMILGLAGFIAFSLMVI